MTPPRDRLVVVTGGADALGHAVTEQFLAEQASVAVLDRPSPALDELQQQGVRAIAVDLTDSAAVEHAFAQVDDLGTPAALITLAGAFQPSTLAELDSGLWDEMRHTNVSSLVWSARAIAARMQGHGGAIVTVGSSARWAAHGFDSPHHDAAQHNAQVTAHFAHQTTGRRLVRARVGTGRHHKTQKRNGTIDAGSKDPSCGPPEHL